MTLSLEVLWSLIRDILIIFVQIIQYLLQFSTMIKSFLEKPSDLLQSPINEDKAQLQTKGPLITFSYAGMLWSYYLGIIAFFRDHFDLYKSSICLSGISCGCSSVLIIFCDLTIEQGFEFGLE